MSDSWWDFFFGKKPEEKAVTGIKIAAGQAVPLPGSVPTAISAELIKGTANAFGQATNAIEGVSTAIQTGKDPVITGPGVDDILLKGAKDAAVAGAKAPGKSLIWKILDFIFGG
jgi:hypothetical protein